MFAVVPRFIAPIARRTFATSSRALISRPSLAASSSFASKWQQQRAYSAEAGLTHDIIQQRILEVLTSFEKVDPAKVTPTASFTTDLGLDSLDAVEVVMAIEEEFSIEIPDEEADKITTVGEAISYVSHTPEAH